MGALVWRVLGTGSAVAAALAARKAVRSGWSRATGKNAPANPGAPGTDTKEAVLFAVATGAVAGVARTLATRKAARYYEQSAGHLPTQLQQRQGTSSRNGDVVPERLT